MNLAYFDSEKKILPLMKILAILLNYPDFEDICDKTQN